ncbi:hypothetical protein CcI156_11505 [Frankia sp. CcI156]|nr:hypothetical protein CgIS1_11680 [Frankia sp. CgIS1]ONH26185.1 hypothetical protein CcI156_11505 [Frankia sp. CcI156]
MDARGLRFRRPTRRPGPRADIHLTVPLAAARGGPVLHQPPSQQPQGIFPLRLIQTGYEGLQQIT